MDLIDFIRESNRIEGIERAPLEREIEAHHVLLRCRNIEISNLETFIALVQPGARLRNQIGLNVRVGSHVPVAGGEIVENELRALLHRANNSTDAWAIHITYEILHPFTDGNGRSGRALWLWMIGGEAPLGFLHEFYYQTLRAARCS